jgi:hypothetical protein
MTISSRSTVKVTTVPIFQGGLRTSPLVAVVGMIIDLTARGLIVLATRDLIVLTTRDLAVLSLRTDSLDPNL